MSSYLSQRIQYKTKGKQYNRASAIITDDVDDLKYSASAVKKMAYVSQKASSSATTTYVAADYLNGDVADNELATIKCETSTPSKVSTHLLDHGYGATPQPTFAQDDAGSKGYTKAAEAGITHYYKVWDIRHADDIVSYIFTYYLNAISAFLLHWLI